MDYLKVVNALNVDVVSYCKDAVMRLCGKNTREAYSEAERIERESYGFPLHSWAWSLPGLSRLYNRAVSDSVVSMDLAKLKAEQAVADNSKRVLPDYDPLLRLVGAVRDDESSKRAVSLRRKEHTERYRIAEVAQEVVEQEAATDYAIVVSERHPDTIGEIVGGSIADAVNEIAEELDSLSAGGEDAESVCSVNEVVVNFGSADSAEVQHLEHKPKTIDFVVPGERVEYEFPENESADTMAEKFEGNICDEDDHLSGNFVHRFVNNVVPYINKSGAYAGRLFTGVSGAAAAVGLAGLVFYLAASYNKRDNIDAVGKAAVVENVKPAKGKGNLDDRYSLAFGGIFSDEEGCSYYAPSLEKIVSGSGAGAYKIVQKASPAARVEGKRERVKPAAVKITDIKTKTEARVRKIASPEKQKAKRDFSAVRSKIQHTVAKGESLWNIVRGYGAEENNIAKAVNDVVEYNASRYPHLKEDNLMVDSGGRTVRGQDGIMGDVIRVRDSYDMAPVVAGSRPFKAIANLAEVQKKAFAEADKSLEEMNKYFSDMHSPDSRSSNEASNAKILEHISNGLI